jgi:hypothetical protein
VLTVCSFPRTHWGIDISLTLTTDMLCKPCLSIFNCNRVQENKLLQAGFHVVCLRDIRLSNRLGCALCAQLYRKLKCSICPPNESDEDFWLTKYHLYYRFVENVGRSDQFTLSFRLSAESPAENLAQAGPSVESVICTHEFHIASFESNYKLSI